MGEAFTGLANDANAIFYNPAGLGQSPLTISWKTYMADSAFTAVAARTASAFGSRDYVWAGSRTGLMRFNGKIWERGDTYVVEEGESLRSVALRYLDIDRKDITDNALWEIRRENKLGMKRYERLVTLLTPYAALLQSKAEDAAHVPEPIPVSVPEPAEFDAAEGLQETDTESTKHETEPPMSAKPLESELEPDSALAQSKHETEPPMSAKPLEPELEPDSALAQSKSVTGASIMAVAGVVKDAVDRVVAAVNAFKDATAKSIEAVNAVKTATQSKNFSAIMDAKKKVQIATEAVKKAKENVTVAIEMLKTAGPEAEAAVKALGIDLSMFTGKGGVGKEANNTTGYGGDRAARESPAAPEVRDYARMLILLPPDESVSSNIADNLLPKSMDEQERKNLADNITEIIGSEDRGIADVTELLIPFTVAVRDTVTVMALDVSERLWVGTVSGLWRHSNGKWRRYTAASEDEDGVLPSGRVTAVAVSPSGTVAVGTDNGLAIMKDLEWYRLTGEDGLPDSRVTSLAYVGEKLHIGTDKGLAVKSGDNSVVVFDTSAGLLSLGVTALFADSKGRLWIGGDNGVTIYSPGAKTWTRYKFPGSTVYSFAEQSGGVVWIGTNKGVVTYKAGKIITGKDGKPTNVPEWKTYHSKNALKNDNVTAITACGKDMWVATDGAMHQYAHAERQVMLFYEQILPAFGMTDLWHGFPAVVIPTEDWGTLAFSVNYINMGENELYSETEVYEGTSRSWEGVFGLSYGFPVREDLSLGLNAKYVYSVLDSRSGGTGQTFAIDAAVLKRNFFVDKLDIGFMLQNMGPSIYYMTPEAADPIPFSLRLGLAYRPVRTPFHELTLVFDAYREVVKNSDSGPDPFWVALWTGMLNNKDSRFAEEIQEINVSLGMEYLYADFMALRLGFLGDYLGERFELSMGLGVKYANMNFDFSYIYSPEGFMSGIVRAMDKNKTGASGVRDGQWRLSFLFGL
jgi:hypothetical protein